MGLVLGLLSAEGFDLAELSGDGLDVEGKRLDVVGVDVLVLRRPELALDESEAVPVWVQIAEIPCVA